MVFRKKSIFFYTFLILICVNSFVWHASAAGPHDYFNTLVAKPERFLSWSLRDAAQLQRREDGGYSGCNKCPLYVTYDPVNDSYSDRQDAAKVIIPANTVSLPNQVRLPLNIDSGKNLITWDAWWGPEYITDRGPINTHKAFQLSGGGNDTLWLEPRASYHSATPGNVASINFRSYNAVGPNMTDEDPVGPQLSGFQINVSTWTRYWVELDYTAVPGRVVMSAWVSDENQNPVKLFDKLNFSDARLLNSFWIEFNTSQYGRTGGELVSYVRNVVVLKNIDDVSSILERPIGGDFTMPSGVPQNNLPSVSLTSPIANQTFSTSDVINFGATASDSDGSISKVEFYQGTTLINSDTSFPYVYSWSNMSAGSYTLTAKAYDNVGASSVSQPITVSVQNVATPPPDAGPVSTEMPAVLNYVYSAPLAGNQQSVSLPNVTSGNAVVVGVSQVDSASRTYSVTDSQGNVYTPVVSTYNSRLSQIFFAKNIVGSSNLAITVKNSGSAVFAVSALEVKGIDVVDTVSSNTQTSNSLIHNCGSAFNTSAKVFVFCVGTLTANGGNLVENNNYVKIGSGTQNIFQYRLSEAPIIGEQVSWNSGTPRISIGAVASFKSTQQSTTPPSDTTPPTISGVSVSSITTSGATITWTTNESSTSNLQYGLTTAYGSTANSSGTISHTVTLTGLQPNTVYNYHITATDAGNNTSVGNNQILTTLPTPDSTPPIVSLTSPGGAITGTVNITAGASDNIGVVGVQFKLDGSNLGGEDTISPYSTTWNSTTASNGQHTLTATARDQAGNSTTSTGVTVTVSNTVVTLDTTPPTVSITSPSAGQVSGTVSISSLVSDNVGVTGVQFKIDGVNFGTEDTVSPYSTTWNSTSVSNGSHTITATARDQAGNTKTSTAVTVAVNNTTSTPPPASGGGGGGGGGVPTTPVTPTTPTLSGGGTPTPTVTTGTPTTPQPQVPASTTVKGPNITRTLTVGSKGADVAELQTFLKSKGYLTTGTADGNFGYLTRDAVQKYQCANLQLCSGSSTTGYGVVGPKTRALLLGTPTTTTTPTTPTTTTNIKLTRTLSFRMRSTEVTTLQTYLISKGYLTQGNATGYFGNLTRQAVQRFQCDKLRICSGSSTTNGYGVVGPRTRGEMGR